MIKKSYTSGEVARICNVHQATIFRAIEGGLIKAATTPGGHYRILREDLETFMKENNVPLSALGAKILRVLVIEDNPLELRLYKRTLQKLTDVEVLATPSGYDGGFLTKAFAPDLILLDIRLKDADGCDVAELIRSDEELKKTRIVAITGIKDLKELKRIKNCGVDHIIQKPISGDELCEKVRTWLNIN